MRKLSSAFLAAVLTTGLLGTDANAGTGVAPGGMIFDCTIVLTFPANNKTTNPTNCVGTATGVIVDGGIRAGITGIAIEPRVGLALGAPWSATAQYTEPCFGGIVGGAIGFSNGRAIVNGITEVFPAAPVHTASLNTEYNWTRVGVVAVVTIGKLALLDNKKPPAQTFLDWGDRTAQDLVGGVAVAVWDASPTLAQTQCVPAPLTVLVRGVFLSL